MSKLNKPTLGMPLPPPPGGTVQPFALSTEAAEALEAFPLPWIVGPYGDVWVGADLMEVKPEERVGAELVEGKWQATCARPRRVLEPADKGISALVVEVMNGALGK